MIPDVSVVWLIVVIGLAVTATRESGIVEALLRYSVAVAGVAVAFYAAVQLKLERQREARERRQIEAATYAADAHAAMIAFALRRQLVSWIDQLDLPDYEARWLRIEEQHADSAEDRIRDLGQLVGRVSPERSVAIVQATVDFYEAFTIIASRFAPPRTDLPTRAPYQAGQIRLSYSVLTLLERVNLPHLVMAEAEVEKWRRFILSADADGPRDWLSAAGESVASAPK